MTRTITVLLADDHALVRESLSNWLREAGDIKIVGEVGSADEAVAVAVRERPDVVLMDIDMPGLLAFDAVRTIRTRCPSTRIVVVSLAPALQGAAFEGPNPSSKKPYFTSSPQM